MDTKIPLFYLFGKTTSLIKVAVVTVVAVAAVSVVVVVDAVAVDAVAVVAVDAVADVHGKWRKKLRNRNQSE